MSSEEKQQAWDRDGFFILRGAVPRATAQAIEAEIVDRIRSDPPGRHPGERTYFSGENYLIYPEVAPSPSAHNPEDRIAKVFNCHAEGLTLKVARDPMLADSACALLGPDIDCFQSQFIFKNPGVVGQPWHQDSYYFSFDQQPQIGVWLALTRATIENGCLWVMPGSHKEPIHEHVPDRRPEALHGYQEIVDYDFSNRVPVLMEPGDVLFFHSYLMHMSTDNVANYRRSAMVYHYGKAGTRLVPGLPAEKIAALQNVNRWIPMRRKSAAG